ncbi:MAG TPA: response regulator, partial [Pseudomonadota bacterium]|nr:response regulator [Pseudomonadota bacterium]
MSGTAQILLVEDDLDFAHALKIILESAGYKVVHVCTTSAASESLREQRFDVVLLDYSLPDSHGLQALETLASYDPELPILFLTGHNDAALAVRALRAGAADYLTKPVARADLLLALDNARKRVLQRQQRVVYRARGTDLSGNQVTLPVGSSATWQHTLELICAAARSPRTTVL